MKKKQLSFSLASRTITTTLPAFLAGILNLTPDSFWGASRENNLEGALKKALLMEEDGANIIDLGGESSRPGAFYVEAEEEIRRIIPVITAIRKRSSVAISVDTRKSQVFKAAFEAGADILNDISALEDDEKLIFYCAEKKNPVILMHKRGTPFHMQKNTEYADVVTEVGQYFSARIEKAVTSGIERDKIILDPGIGFGKDDNANLALLRYCGNFKKKLGLPVMVGLSRKSLIGNITGRQLEERLPGTLAAQTLAVLYGASFLRVHDIKAMKDCLKVLRSVDHGRF